MLLTFNTYLKTEIPMKLNSRCSDDYYDGNADIKDDVDSNVRDFD